MYIQVCSFWFHTSFVEGDVLVLMKADLDGPPKKDKKVSAHSPTTATIVLLLQLSTNIGTMFYIWMRCRERPWHLHFARGSSLFTGPYANCRM